jgi:amino acid adenylation domain-containing protein/non-ribosomal peptide synthase protein (TIGR01720 family)
MKDAEYSGKKKIIASQFSKEKDFWLTRLSGDFVKSRFPYDKRLEAESPYELKSIPFKIPAEISSKLADISNYSDVRIYIILTAAQTVLLHKYTGKNDIVVGCPIYKQETAGDFINSLLLLRNQFDRHISFKQLVLQVSRNLAEAIDNQNFPIESLVYHLDLPTVENECQLFDVAILMENIQEKRYLGSVRYNMLFNFFMTENSLELAVEYNAALYNEGTIRRIGAHFSVILTQVIDDVNIGLDRLELLTPREREQLLAGFRGTGAGYPAKKTVRQLFEDQAVKMPDHTAVVYERQSLTYGELNRAANRLAAVLSKRGVSAETIVGMLLEPSLEMITGILGVLKAGGTYLPIDARYPEERVLHILKDSRLQHLLTTKDIARCCSFNRLQGIQEINLKPHLTPRRPQILDFDSLPFPDRSLVNYEKFSRFIGLALVKNSLSVQATRGCPYNCAFCHKIWPKNHVCRSAENIFAEVRHYYDLGVKRFSFIDDIFNLNAENSLRFFRLVIDNGLDVQFFFPDGLRGDILTEGYIDVLAQAGTRSIALALETASPRLQKLIGKNLKLEKLRKNIDYICTAYPHIVLELFTMLGFPTETEEEALQTLEFIKQSKWIDFPIVSILKIYPNTDMARLAVENGISYEAIARSQDLAFHELPETLPFSKSFVSKYQAAYLNDYFLSKERLRHLLPYQMRLLTEDEMVQKYNSYLPVAIECFDDLLDFVGISRGDMGVEDFFPEDGVFVPDLNEKIRNSLPQEEPEGDAFRVLFIDLSQFFSGEVDILYDVVEAPLGLMYVMTYLKQQFGSRISGKIIKSRIDFDNFEQLKVLLAEFKPQVIGLRALTYFKNFFHQTASVIRHWGVDVPILAGGPYATSDYEAILQDANIDLVVMGEGEITAAQIIGEIMKCGGRLPGESVLKTIPGIAFVPPKAGAHERMSRDIILMDELTGLLAAESAGNPVHIDRSCDLAYIIYTSGTTGLPKGVMIENKNLVSLMAHDRSPFDFDSADVWTMFHSYNFDFSIWEMYGALLNGGRLVVIPRDTARDSQRYLQVLLEEKVTVLNQTPTAFYSLINEELQYPPGGLNLKYVIFGGEALNPFKLKRWKTRYPGTKLINMFGITETTVHVTHKALTDQEIESNISNIGVPLPTLGRGIVDAHLELLPPGIPGELCVAGEGVGRGYLNGPALTEARFVTNSCQADERFYRSGDLVRLLDSGEMEYLGRVDQQVKIRGFRIEPAEIENRLLNIGGVKDAVVIDREDEGRERYLCAYVVSDDGLDVMDLRLLLSNHLPSYMIPANFVKLDKIPLTPNGKLDRKALPTPGIRADETYVAPMGDLEKRLVKIWADVLTVDEDAIGIHADFFELGGHSLKATSLVSRIARDLHTKVPYVEIFKTPTVAGLASYIKGTTAREKHAAIQPAERKEYYPLSSAQKRMYVLQQMDLQSVSYNIPIVEVLAGAIDGLRLEDTFKRLIRRHESFRTSFEMVDGMPRQRIHHEAAFALTYRDVNIEEPAKLVEEFVRPFDLSQAPLLRACLTRAKTGHFLLIDIHHIISDGVSHQVLIEDFMQLYRGGTLPGLRLQYRDYALWEQKRKRQDSFKRQAEYWLERFSAHLPVLQLPTDFDRPAVQVFAGSTVGFVLDQRQTGILKNIVRTTDSTLFMVMLAVYNILLSRLSGQESIIVGIPIAARRHVDLERLIGMFVNTLPIRNEPAGDKRFTDFLREVKENSLEAFENQEYPFEDLVDRLSVERDTGRNPVFNVVFNLLNQDEYFAIDLDEIEQDTYRHRPGTAKFDITLATKDFGKRLYVSFEYCVKLFRPQTIERFIGFFRKIIDGLDVNLEQEIFDIEILSAGEKDRLLYGFNDTQARYPRERTVHELIEEQVDRYPQAAALTFEDSQMSYLELGKRANRLAAHLRQRGVLPDTIVAIMVEPSLEMVVGITGILKAGGAYLPIDCDYPPNRIAFMLADSCARELLTTRGAAPSPGFIEKTYLDDRRIFRQQGPHLDNINTPADLVYIIYTSGTTGKPKGVMVEHRNVVRLFCHDRLLFDFSSRDVWTMFHSYCFDFSVWEMFGALLTGAKLIIITKMTARDPLDYLRVLTGQGVTVLNQTPSAFYNLCRQVLASGDFDLQVRYVIFGGEALAPIKLAGWKSKYRHTRLINMYGITETTVHVTYKEITDHEIKNNHGNIGRPIPTLTAYVLGKYRELLPLGTMGELCVGGEGVGRGYLNRQELTAERFVPNPYVPQERLYRSGDLVTLSAAGEMTYIGRGDQQVKIRGYRIELGEIENRLLRHGEIKEAVVVAKEGEGKARYLCAYIAARRELTLLELREYLAGYLPGYMIPAYFVHLEKIPLTPNGKLDRRALPEPAESGLESGLEYLEPRNEVEKRLVEVWCEVLGRDNINIRDNFFTIGGDSIKTIQIAARMRKYGYRVEMREIFRNPTIYELSRHVGRLERTADQSAVTGLVPLTPIQEDFFLRSPRYPHHFNQAVMLKSKESFEEAAVEAIFTKIRQHHDALRITFTGEAGEIIQVNHGLDQPLSLDVFDLRNHPNALTVLEDKVNEIQTGLRLDASLLKLGLFHLDDGDRLLLVVHHLVIDGVSWRILFEEIESLYRQYREGEALWLPMKTDSYKAWAERLAAYADTRAFLAEKAYWARGEAAEIAAVDRDFSGADNLIKDATSLSFGLDEPETELLLTGANGAFATEVNDLLLTALGLAIKKTWGVERVLILLEGHGRENILADIDISRTVGWFTSIYPVVLNMSYEADGKNLSRQIKQVKESLHQVPARGIGYGILKYLTAAGHKGDIRFKLQPQFSFNYLGQFDEDIKRLSSFEIVGQFTGNSQHPEERRPHDFDVSGMIVGNRLRISVVYNKRQYRPETIKKLLNTCKGELITIIRHCARLKEREFSPVDFTFKALSIDQVDRLASRYRLEDIYPLSPMQEGLLFHSLFDRSSHAFFEQISYRLRGELHIPLVKKSLGELFRRHDILRTAFIHEGVDRPLQVVTRDRQVDFCHEDIRHLREAPAKEAYIKRFKERDKQNKFDLSQDVLMRVTIIQLDELEHEFIWTHHHILMDGWCVGILIEEFVQIYYGYYNNRAYALPPVNPYRTYIEWLENQDKERSRVFWKEYLAGCREPVTITKMGVHNPVHQPGYRNEEVALVLDREKTDRLNQLAVGSQVTMNTLVHGVWGVLLQKYTNSQDVVFGTVVSGRPSEIEGVEAMIGLFINIVPVRMKLADDIKFKDLLEGVQQAAIDCESHHYYPLTRIQAENSPHQNLFDHLLSFQNYPIARQIDGLMNRDDKDYHELKFAISNAESYEQGIYDLNVRISVVDERLAVEFKYNGNVYEKSFLQMVGSHFEEIVDQVLDDEDRPLKDIAVHCDLMDVEVEIDRADYVDFSF